MKTLRSIIVIAATVLAAVVHADPAFDFYASNVAVLENRQVQNDMGVTDAQRKRMNDFANADRPQRKAIIEQFQREAQAAQKAGKPYRADYNKLKPLDVSLKKNVLSVLQPKQLQRLREITVQGAGLVALLDDRVAAQAGVPSATVEKLRSVFREGAQKANAARQEIQKAVLAEYSKIKPKTEAEAKRLQEEAFKKYSKQAGPVLTKIQAQTQQKMLSLLTAKQKASLKALGGPPVKK